MNRLVLAWPDEPKQTEPAGSMCAATELKPLRGPCSIASIFIRNKLKNRCLCWESIPIRCDFGTTEEMNHVCYQNMWSIPMVSNRGLTSGSLLRPTDQWTNSLTDSISGPVFSTMLIDRGGYQAGLARMLLQWAHPARSQDRSGQGRHQTPSSPRAQANKQEEQACGASWWSAERAGDQNARWQAAVRRHLFGAVSSTAYGSLSIFCRWGEYSRRRPALEVIALRTSLPGSDPRMGS